MMNMVNLSIPLVYYWKNVLQGNLKQNARQYILPQPLQILNKGSNNFKFMSIRIF